MEQQLQQLADNLIEDPLTVGCVLLDTQGLCLNRSGVVPKYNLGLMSAIAKQASKLHPDFDTPVVLLESSAQTCMIYNRAITASIFKLNSKCKPI